MVTILLVDDSSYVRDSLRGVLCEAGHEVVAEATNAEEAVEKYRKFNPDIVLMDIVMESANTTDNGLDAIEKILSQNPEANIIICSALDEQMLIKKALQIGAKAFVTKPVDPEKLLETVMMCSDLRIIAEIGNMGAGRAATILSKLAKQPIQIDLPKLESGPPNLFARLNGSLNRGVTAVHMKLQGEKDCDVLIAFELSEATKISEIMTEKSKIKDIQEMQQSAIKEMGSNMICGFFGAIADFLEITLVPSAPKLVVDSFEAVVDVFLAKMAIVTQTALLFQIRLKREAGSAHGLLLIIPSPEFQKQLIDAGKRWLSITAMPTPLIN